MTWNPRPSDPDPTTRSRCTTASSPRSTHLPELAQRAEGDDQLREWAGLAALDAVELGEQLGMPHDDEAARRREVIRAAIEDLDRPGR